MGGVSKSDKFRVSNINDLEMLYSTLRDMYPNNAIEILFDWNTKQYNIKVSDEPYVGDPDVPIDLDVQVVYGDSITSDTPLLLKKNGLIYIEIVKNIFDENKCYEYPGFKMFDKTIRLEKQYSESDYQIWSDSGWVDIKKVIRHKTDKKIYRVLTNTGSVDVTEDHSLIRDNFEIVKPNDLEIGDRLLSSFPKIFDKKSEFFYDNTFEHKLEIQRSYYLLKSSGIDVSIRYIEECDRFVFEKNKMGTNVVKNIIDIGPTKDYVYDIETESGRFGAGIGDIIVKNTDSCFLKFKYNRSDFQLNRRDTFRLATLCGDILTDDIFKRPPIELEFEKVFQPFILLTKKRYIANKYENPKDPFQLKCVDAKGIALTRRDYCPMVKKCYKQIIDTILNEKNYNDNNNSNTKTGDSITNSIVVYKSFIDEIVGYKINIDELVVSAMLASSYKTRPVHVQLAERLKERKEQVQIGDRIPYIYIESDDSKKQKSELGEDPKYAIRNNLKYNRCCYLEQLAKPILGFYKIVLKDNERLLDDIIKYTNDAIVGCGGRALKPSDFKIEDD